MRELIQLITFNPVDSSTMIPPDFFAQFVKIDDDDIEYVDLCVFLNELEESEAGKD